MLDFSADTPEKVSAITKTLIAANRQAAGETALSPEQMSQVIEQHLQYNPDSKDYSIKLHGGSLPQQWLHVLFTMQKYLSTSHVMHATSFHETTTSPPCPNDPAANTTLVTDPTTIFPSVVPPSQQPYVAPYAIARMQNDYFASSLQRTSKTGAFQKNPTDPSARRKAQETRRRARAEADAPNPTAAEGHRWQEEQKIREKACIQKPYDISGIGGLLQDIRSGTRQDRQRLAQLIVSAVEDFANQLDTRDDKTLALADADSTVYLQRDLHVALAKMLLSRENITRAAQFAELSSKFIVPPPRPVRPNAKVAPAPSVSERNREFLRLHPDARQFLNAQCAALPGLTLLLEAAVVEHKSPLNGYTRAIQGKSDDTLPDISRNYSKQLLETHCLQPSLLAYQR